MVRAVARFGTRRQPARVMKTMPASATERPTGVKSNMEKSVPVSSPR